MVSPVPTETLSYKRCYTLAELPQVVAEVQALHPEVRIWLLEGPLGSGKTTFVRTWIGEEVASPTFTYIHRYRQAVHVDLYRFPWDIPSRWAELEEAIQNASLVFIEWADRLPFTVSPPWAKVVFLPQEDPYRCLQVSIAHS
ncbi:MAG: tRNA (adenosine(37)-N6)-threonylcarbamoyltransferase complex ATPase subunit type 1 TsaE [Bacteroidia bacterium]|nr:tRNA (adenosine(37)-N6)-threonylcarbamoyltransferase complex ATPase subunit type 1 TsaE [Bacteroidia bacterium]MDW8235145.1 tRNA (adenosine(37)-N6)-threonylcarbamoyltransferase complex ATPase subunit type 1 TsaE [Bacteroidia bacterium]